MSQAQRIAEAIWPADAASRWLGMKLADSSFGYACNSHNQRALAASASIKFLAPGSLDEVLVAECVESAKAGRRGIYDARVLNPKGETIALFRGESAIVRGTWIE